MKSSDLVSEMMSNKSVVVWAPLAVTMFVIHAITTQLHDIRVLSYVFCANNMFSLEVSDL